MNTVSPTKMQQQQQQQQRDVSKTRHQNKIPVKTNTNAMSAPSSQTVSKVKMASRQSRVEQQQQQHQPQSSRQTQQIKQAANIPTKDQLVVDTKGKNSHSKGQKPQQQQQRGKKRNLSTVDQSSDGTNLHNNLDSDNGTIDDLHVTKQEPQPKRRRKQQQQPPLPTLPQQQVISQPQSHHVAASGDSALLFNQDSKGSLLQLLMDVTLGDLIKNNDGDDGEEFLSAAEKDRRQLVMAYKTIHKPKTSRIHGFFTNFQKVFLDPNVNLNDNLTRLYTNTTGSYATVNPYTLDPTMMMTFINMVCHILNRAGCLRVTPEALKLLPSIIEEIQKEIEGTMGDIQPISPIPITTTTKATVDTSTATQSPITSDVNKKESLAVRHGDKALTARKSKQTAPSKREMVLVTMNDFSTLQLPAGVGLKNAGEHVQIHNVCYGLQFESALDSENLAQQKQGDQIPSEYVRFYYVTVAVKQTKATNKGKNTTGKPHIHILKNNTLKRLGLLFDSAAPQQQQQKEQRQRRKPLDSDFIKKELSSEKVTMTYFEMEGESPSVRLQCEIMVPRYPENALPNTYKNQYGYSTTLEFPWNINQLAPLILIPSEKSSLPLWVAYLNNGRDSQQQKQQQQQPLLTKKQQAQTASPHQSSSRSTKTKVSSLPPALKKNCVEASKLGSSRTLPQNRNNNNDEQEEEEVEDYDDTEGEIEQEEGEVNMKRRTGEYSDGEEDERSGGEEDEYDGYSW